MSRSPMFAALRTRRWRASQRRMLVFVVLALFFTRSAARALPEEQAPTDTPERASSSDDDVMKARVLLLPPGSPVEVRLIDGEKVRGRLGALSEDGFVVKTVRKNALSEQKVAFSELKSVKPIAEVKVKDTGEIVDKTLNRGKLVLGLAAAGTALGVIIWAVSNNGNKSPNTVVFRPR